MLGGQSFADGTLGIEMDRRVFISLLETMKRVSVNLSVRKVSIIPDFAEFY